MYLFLIAKSALVSTVCSPHVFSRAMTMFVTHCSRRYAAAQSDGWLIQFNKAISTRKPLRRARDGEATEFDEAAAAPQDLQNIVEFA